MDRVLTKYLEVIIYIIKKQDLNKTYHPDGTVFLNKKHL